MARAFSRRACSNGCYCRCGHDRHLMRFDAELAGDAIKLMDGDAHGVGVDSGVYGSQID